MAFSSSVDTNAYTLAEIAARSKSDGAREIINALHDGNNILTDLPLRTMPELKVSFSRWDQNSTLPGVHYKRINDLPTAVKGQPSFYSEEAFLVRENFIIDRLLKRMPNQLGNAIDDDFAVWKQVMQCTFNKNFIYNDHGVSGDSNAPVGIQARLANTTTYGLISDTKIDSGGLDLTPANITAATARNLFHKMGLIQSRVLGSGTRAKGVWYCNMEAQEAIGTAIRVLGGGAGFRTDQDAYGRTFDSFRGMPIKDVGYDSDQTTYIIPNTEPSTGIGRTGGATTSLYFVAFGDQQCTGWQVQDIDLEYVGRNSEGSHDVHLVEWACGWVLKGPRSVGQLFNLTVA